MWEPFTHAACVCDCQRTLVFCICCPLEPCEYARTWKFERVRFSCIFCVCISLQRKRLQITPDASAVKKAPQMAAQRPQKATQLPQKKPHKSDELPNMPCIVKCPGKSTQRNVQEGSLIVKGPSTSKQDDDLEWRLMYPAKST